MPPVEGPRITTATRRILIAYVTAGAGHRRAAEALAEAVRRRLPEAQVDCLDALADAPAWFRTGYNTTYLLLVRHLAWVWKVSYAALDSALGYRLIQPLRRWWNLRIARRFARRLREAAYDVVVVTHFLPADICATGTRGGWLRAPTVVVVTDFHPHRFWLSGEARAVVGAVPETARTLALRGVAPARTHVLGIPVSAAFSRPADRAALQQRFALSPERLTVLVTSGGTTVGHFERVVWALLALELRLPGRLQVVAVCGADAGTRDRLTARAQRSAMPLRVFGFVEFMADLMAVSDLVVSKAGGLTVSEALARGRPLVLYHVIPGQERMNAKYVAAHGAAMIAPHVWSVADAVRRFANDAALRQSLARRAGELGRPDAADAIAAEVIVPLAQARQAADGR